MLKKFYTKNNLNKFMTFEELSALPIINFKKGKKFFLDHMYFIIHGRVELFITNDKKETMKISNIDSQKYILGILKPLDYRGMSLFYRASTDISLISISEEIFDKLENNLDFLKTSRDIAFDHLMETTQTLFIRNIYSSQDILRYTLEKNTDSNDELFIDDLKEFLTDNHLSRSIFYNTLKVLEDNGDIKRKGNFIKFLNYKFIV